MLLKLNIGLRFIQQIFLLLVFLLSGFAVSAQETDKKAVREARNSMKEAAAALEEEDFALAEARYREAIAKDPENASARYNLGNLYYNEELTDQSVSRHWQASNLSAEKELKHKAFHNQGNAFMKQERYPEAVEAFKSALRNDPTDEETRYNLAYAKKKMEEEEQGGGEDGDQDQKGENQEQDSENQDQEGDQGEENQDNQGDPQENEAGDQENEEQGENPQDGDQNEQEQQQGDQDQQQPQQQPQPTPGQLSPEQIKSLLEAMGNEEKKVQDKINAEKVRGAKTRSEKDW